MKPIHIAIIPDGNRRWARKHHLPKSEGHRAGIERFSEIADAIFEQKIPFATFWAASKDNLKKRSRGEVSWLLFLLKQKLRQLISSDQLQKKQIRFRVVGCWNNILKDKKLEHLILSLEKNTRHLSKYNLTLLFGYDGRQEMLKAIKEIRKNKKLPISYEGVKSQLDTGFLPPVDLVIRTGGEPHWSAGFMMWHTTDSQFYFTDTLWPDFDENNLKEALADYSGRQRRFGA